MHKYVELLKTAEKIIKQLASDTQTAVHNMSQAKIDYDSLMLQVVKKRQELEKLDQEHKDRMVSYENGLKRITDDANRAFAEAHELKRKTEHELAEAQRARTLAEALKSELERERREYAVVSGARKKA